VEQELLALSEHMGSPPVFSGVHVAVLVSVHLRFTASDYPFGLLQVLFMKPNAVVLNVSIKC